MVLKRYKYMDVLFRQSNRLYVRFLVLLFGMFFPLLFDNISVKSVWKTSCYYCSFLFNFENDLVFSIFSGGFYFLTKRPNTHLVIKYLGVFFSPFINDLCYYLSSLSRYDDNWKCSLKFVNDSVNRIDHNSMFLIAQHFWHFMNSLIENLSVHDSFRFIIMIPNVINCIQL